MTLTLPAIIYVYCPAKEAAYLKKRIIFREHDRWAYQVKNTRRARGIIKKYA